MTNRQQRRREGRSNTKEIPLYPLDRTSPDFRKEMMEWCVYFRLLNVSIIPKESSTPMVSLTPGFLEHLNLYFRDFNKNPDTMTRKDYTECVMIYLVEILNDRTLAFKWRDILGSEPKTRLMYDITDYLVVLCKSLNREALDYPN